MNANAAADAELQQQQQQPDAELPPITKPPVLQVAIGKGSFGVVWKARDEHGRDVAVKIVPLVHSAGAVEEELDQEVELMRRFCHPNLVQFHTAFRMAEARQVWVVMELCEAGSLLSVIRQHGPLGADEVGAVCVEVLVALRYLHLEQSTVHRDVKAANVLLTASAQVKLADFGSSSQDITQTVIGTPHWMAPEVRPPSLTITASHHHHPFATPRHPCTSPAPPLRHPMRHPCTTPAPPGHLRCGLRRACGRVVPWYLGHRDEPGLASLLSARRDAYHVPSRHRAVADIAARTARGAGLIHLRRRPALRLRRPLRHQGKTQ